MIDFLNKERNQDHLKRHRSRCNKGKGCKKCVLTRLFSKHDAVESFDSPFEPKLKTFFEKMYTLIVLGTRSLHPQVEFGGINFTKEELMGQKITAIQEGYFFELWSTISEIVPYNRTESFRYEGAFHLN